MNTRDVEELELEVQYLREFREAYRLLLALTSLGNYRTGAFDGSVSSINVAYAIARTIEIMADVLKEGCS